MRYLTLVAVILGALTGLTGPSPQSAQAAPVCPTTANTNTDCGFIITIGANGAITGAAVANANPYDGSDDALVGVVNNSGAAYNGSFRLSGTGDGGGLFGFDGDGICTFTNAAYCSTAATGYEGPNNTFSNISPDQTTGTVNITGLGISASTYFSLEGSPASIAASGGLGTPTTGGSSTVPEPATFAILGAGLIGLMSSRRHRN